MRKPIEGRTSREVLVATPLAQPASSIDSRSDGSKIPHELAGWRVRLSVQDTALSRLKDGFDSRTRYHFGEVES